MLKLDVKPEPEVIGPSDATIEIEAVGSDGKPVSGATILVKRGSAEIDSVAVAKTDANGTATVSISPTLGPNQDQGSLTIDLKPPPDRNTWTGGGTRRSWS